MKKYLTIAVLCLTSSILSQETPKISLSIGDYFSLPINDGPNGNMFNGLFLKSGVALRRVNYNLIYSYRGQYNYKSKKFNDYNCHFLGVGIKYFLLDNEKFKPNISLEIMTELGTKNKGNLMRQYLTITQQSSYSLQELSQQNSHYFDDYEEYDSWIGNVYYQSTPFSGTLLIGCDFKLCKNLYLNFGLGLGIRSIKVLKPVTRITKNYNVFSADAQLGLTYAFPLKKKITE